MDVFGQTHEGKLLRNSFPVSFGSPMRTHEPLLVCGHNCWRKQEESCGLDVERRDPTEVHIKVQGSSIAAQTFLELKTYCIYFFGNHIR